MAEQVGCQGCHAIAGIKWEKYAPSLRFEALKTTREWLEKKIEHPEADQPRGRMPAFKLERSEIAAIASYLIESSSPFVLDPIEISLGDAAGGEKLFREIGCLGCHSLEHKSSDSGPNHGPNLSEVGSKVDPTWLFHWISNPKRFHPKTRMPNLRLSPQEALDVTAFLASLRAEEPISGATAPFPSEAAPSEGVELGKKLIAEHGCYGCHGINGFEGVPRIAGDLAGWGASLSSTHEDSIPEKRRRLIGKLTNPESLDSEWRRLPRYHRLSEPDLESLAVAFASAPLPSTSEPDPRAAKIEAGRRLVRKFNCTGCHVMERAGDGSPWGGDILDLIVDPGNHPPTLVGEGGKIQRSWLESYLPDVKSIRPWLEVRMPTFGFSAEERAALVEYFLAVEGMDSSQDGEVPSGEFDPRIVGAGMHIFHGFQCFSCHPVNEAMIEAFPDKSALAPDLSLVPDRLRYDWISDWILDPQAIQPGTKMPAFFEDGRSHAHLMIDQPENEPIKIWFDSRFAPEEQEEFLSDATWTAEAVRDFLWTFDADAYLSKFPWTPSAVAPSERRGGRESFDETFGSEFE